MNSITDYAEKVVVNDVVAQKSVNDVMAFNI